MLTKEPPTFTIKRIYPSATRGYTWTLSITFPENKQLMRPILHMNNEEFSKFCCWMHECYQNYQVGYIKYCLKEANSKKYVQLVRQEFKDWKNWKNELGDFAPFTIINRFSKNTNVYKVDNIMKKYFKQKKWHYIPLDSLPKIGMNISNSISCPICNNFITSTKSVEKCKKCKSLIRI